jgi:hypothetical protein
MANSHHRRPFFFLRALFRSFQHAWVLRLHLRPGLSQFSKNEAHVGSSVFMTLMLYAHV